MNSQKSTYTSVISELMKEDPAEIEFITKAQQKIATILTENKPLFDLFKSIQPIIEAIKPVRDFMKPIIEVHQSIKEYIDVRQKLAAKVSILPLSGWYLSLEFIDNIGATALDSLLKQQGDDLCFDKQFVDLITNLFEQNLSVIENKITGRFSKRAHLIKQIFKLHKQQDYIASIPLALTQADGMCKDVFYIIDKNGKKKPIGFFNLEPGKESKRAQTLSKTIIAPETSIFNILTNQLAKSDRNLHILLEGNTSRFSDLNRHAIIHGESVDYGIYVNSVKSILLLDFISELQLVNEAFLEPQELD